mgnify:FL=1|tara:strand:- start:5370 stop:6755 length:1386 start_codon:yes stop_codon:yes gene_type:complete
MSEVINWATLAKTSVTSSHYIPVTSRLKFQLQSLFPSLATAGTGSESLYVNVTNGNQLNFKGIKSGDTGLLTVTTASNNIVITALEAGIDLSKCDNSTSNFLSTVALASNVSGILSIVNGGTGLSSVTKGSILYASAANTLAASSPIATNGQLLVGNTSNGYPSVATLTAGTGMTITNGAGSITLAASMSSAGSDIDLNTYNINMDAAAGNSFLSGDGTDEGITVDANGRVIVGDTTPTILSTSAQLSLQGGSGTAIEIGNTNTYKAYTIKVRNATSGAGAALSLSGADGGSGNTAGGAINVISGTGSGSGTGGDTNVLGGAGGGSGAGGAINLTTYSGSGSGTAVKGLHITNAQTVEISNGFLRYSQTPQTLTGAGAVDITSQITHFTDTGTNALTLADGANGQTKIICQIATAGGAGTLTPSNLAGGTNITFNAVGENAQLLFTNSSWHVIGISGATIA